MNSHITLSLTRVGVAHGTLEWLDFCVHGHVIEELQPADERLVAVGALQIPLIVAFHVSSEQASVAEHLAAHFASVGFDFQMSLVHVSLKAVLAVVCLTTV